MIGFVLALALAGAQDARPDWRAVPNEGDIVVEYDMAALHRRDGLRITDTRRSAPGSPRMVIMTVAIDCKAETVALEGEVRFYDTGKLVKNEPIPTGADVQQKSVAMGEVIKAVCAI